MNFKKSSILIFVCLVHVQTMLRPSEGQDSAGLIASFCAFVSNAVGVGARDVRNEQQKFADRVIGVSEFYKNSCVCPEGIDPEFFKILVGAVYKESSINCTFAEMMNTYQKDQKGIVSDFGKFLQTRAVELAKQPLMLKEYGSRKTRVQTLSVHKSLQEYVNKMEESCKDNCQSYIEPFGTIACHLFWLLPKQHRTNIEKLQVYYKIVTIYNEFKMQFLRLEPDVKFDEELYNRMLQVFTNVVYCMIEAGDFKDHGTENFDCDARRTKLSQAYYQEKMQQDRHIILNAESRKFASLNQEKNQFLHDYKKIRAYQGFLPPEKAQDLIAEQARSYQKLKETERDASEKIERLAFVDRVRMDFEKQNLQERTEIEQECLQERKNWWQVQLESLWKASGKQLVLAQVKERQALKVQAKQDLNQVEQQEVAQNLLQKHETFDQRLFDACRARLNQIAVTEKDEKAEVLVQEQENNAIRLSYFTALVASAQAQRAIKNQQPTIVLQRNGTRPLFETLPPAKPQREKLSPKLSVQSASQPAVALPAVIPGAPIPVAVVPAMIASAPLVPPVVVVAERRNNPYAGSLLPADLDSLDSEYVAGFAYQPESEESLGDYPGWFQDEYGNWFPDPNFKLPPDYFDQHRVALPPPAYF